MVGSGRFRRISIVLALSAAAIGLAVLIGWLIDNPLLKSVRPDFISMKPNTALCLVLLGLALALQQTSSTSQAGRISARLLAILVAGIGLLSLSQYVFGIDWGIDQFIFPESPGASRTVYLGRMAPTAAIAFMLLGTSVCLNASRFASMAAQISCTIGSAISLFVLVGYAYEVEWLTGLATYTPMAMHTAAAFLLLSMGILCAHPDHGIVGLLRRPTSGGLMLRFMLPMAVVLPLFVGWLRLEGEGAGMYGARLGTSIFALTVTVAFVAALTWIAMSMNRLDEKRRRATEQFDQFFNVSLDMLCIAGTDRMFKRINQAWAKTLGYSTEELLSKPYLDFVHPEDLESTIAAATKLTQGHDVTSFENRYRRSDGSYVWLNWVCRAPDSKGGHIFGIARDLTERKLHEEETRRLNLELEERNREAREANRELETFSYSVSHDLRTPLRSLDGFSRALLEDYGETLDSTATGYLHRIRSAAQRMGALIDDLLQLSRMARLEMHTRHVDLTEMANGIVRELRQHFPDRQVDVLIDGQMSAQGDPHLLQAVLQNLIGNAWKYTALKPHAHIRCGVIEKHGGTVFFVKDDGAGFDMAYADKLFGAFQRLHSAEEFEGNGIGLATVQRIIHRHGGRVWAEGEVNCGATFYFTVEPMDTQGESDDGQDDPARGRQRGRRDIDSPCVEAEQYHQ